MYSSAKLIALFTLVVCLTWSANADDDNLEDRFANKFGTGKIVEWGVIDSLDKTQLEDICKSVHELTGYGPADIKEAATVNAYLKFSNSKKHRPVYTKMLSCKKNNKHQYTYYVTQGVDKNGITLVHPDPSKRKIKGKEVFLFWWLIGQVRFVPTLQKLAVAV